MTEQLVRLQLLSKKNLAIAVSRQSGRGKEALDLLNEAIAANPKDITLLDSFGTIAAQVGEWNAAKKAFVSGLAKDRSHASMTSKLLQVLRHLKDYTALSAFENVLESRPNSCLGEANSQQILQEIAPPIEKGADDGFKSDFDKVNINVVSWSDLLSKMYDYYKVEEFHKFEVVVTASNEQASTPSGGIKGVKRKGDQLQSARKQISKSNFFHLEPNDRDSECEHVSRVESIRYVLVVIGTLVFDSRSSLVSPIL